jgi:5-methylcytosine-specific restriction endonuclease McrA
MVKKDKTKKKPKYNKDSAIRGALRRAFSRSPVVREVMDAVRRERPWFKKDGSQAAKPRVEYCCSKCGEYFMGKDIQVDHTIPVVDPEIGFTNYQDYIDRLFCEASNLSVLCKKHHEEKTNYEKTVAKERRQREKDALK